MLGLDRPPVNMLVVGLVLVLLRFVYLLLLGACVHHVNLYIGGACSLGLLGDHTNHVCGVAITIYRRERCNLAGSLIMKTRRAVRERSSRRPHLHVEKA